MLKFYQPFNMLPLFFFGWEMKQIYQPLLYFTTIWLVLILLVRLIHILHTSGHSFEILSHQEISSHLLCPWLCCAAARTCRNHLDSQWYLFCHYKSGDIDENQAFTGHLLIHCCSCWLQPPLPYPQKTQKELSRASVDFIHSGCRFNIVDFVDLLCL